MDHLTPSIRCLFKMRAEQICKMNTRTIESLRIIFFWGRGGGFTWHLLYKKINQMRHYIVGVTAKRNILLPLYLFVMTLPINLAVASGNGNSFLHKNLKSPKSYAVSRFCEFPSKFPVHFLQTIKNCIKNRKTKKSLGHIVTNRHKITNVPLI